MISLPLGRLAGQSTAVTKRALTVEHDDGLKSVFVVVGVEQPQLLAAVDRIERVVDVERDPFGNRRKGLAIEIHHRATHPHQGANIGQIFQPRDRRLRTEFPIRRRQIERHLEHRIAPQAIGIVAVLIARGDHQQPKADDVGKAVGDLIGRAPVHHTGGEPLGDAKALVDLAQRQNAAIRRQQAAVKLDLDALARNR